MKTKTATLFASLLLAVSANAQLTVLLGGFDGNNAVDAPVQSTIASNEGVGVVMALSGGSVGYTWAGGSSSNDKWGTADYSPLPTTGNANTAGRIDGGGGVYTFTITAGTSDITLESLHWIARRDDNVNSPDGATIAFVSSTDTDLVTSASTGTNVNVAMSGTAHTGYDASLADIFGGTRTLSAGEELVISWSSTYAGAGTGTSRVRMDNFAVAGSVNNGDVTPPSPSTSTWASVPAAVSESSISMTATTSTDANGVEYFFDETTGGGTDSGWQLSPEYTDSGLTPNTEYTYTVTVRDGAGNTTTASTAESVFTDVLDETAPNPDPIDFLVAPVAVSPSAISMTAQTATDPTGVQYRFVQTPSGPGGTSSGWQDSPTYIDTGLSPNTEYTYEVHCRDKSITVNETGTSTASATTHSSGGIGTLLLGGFGGKSATAIQSASISDVVVTLTSPEVAGVPQDGNFQGDNATWGNSALDVEPPTIANGQDTGKAAVIQEGTLSGWSLVLTITNNGTEELSLDGLHFLTKKDTNDQGPEYFTIAYTTGDLGAPASTTVALLNGAGNKYDIPLASFLSDTTLAGGGETATFTWTPGPPENPSGNTGLRLDNFAISGDVVLGGPTYATWSGSEAADADANGDGVSNGAAWVLGAADVNANAIGLQPTLDNTSDVDFVIFNFNRSDEAVADPGTAITVQYGSDLAGWTDAVPGADVIITAVDGSPTDAVEVKIRRSLAVGGKLFARLNVVVTP